MVQYNIHALFLSEYSAHHKLLFGLIRVLYFYHFCHLSWKKPGIFFFDLQKYSKKWTYLFQIVLKQSECTTLGKNGCLLWTFYLFFWKIQILVVVYKWMCVYCFIFVASSIILTWWRISFYENKNLEKKIMFVFKCYLSKRFRLWLIL